MSKTVSKLALAAGISLALAFTFSCSDNGGEDDPVSGGGGEPGSQVAGQTGITSNLPDALLQELATNNVQVYRNFFDEPPVEYDGNGNVFVRLQGDSLPAGTIRGGKLSLTLPALKSKYLYPMSYFNNSECKGVSVNPANLTGADIASPRVTLPDGNECRLYLYLLPNHDRAVFLYFSGPGTITGIRTCTDGYRTSQRNWKVNGSSGWNIVNHYETNSGMDTSSTDLSEISALAFQLENCNAPPPPPGNWSCYADSSPFAEGVQTCFELASMNGLPLTPQEFCEMMKYRVGLSLEYKPEPCPSSPKLTCEKDAGGNPVYIHFYGAVPAGVTCSDMDD